MKNLAVFLCALLLLAGCSKKGATVSKEDEAAARVKQLEAQQHLMAETLKDLVAQSKAYQLQTEQMFTDLQITVLSLSTNMDNVGQLFLEHLGNASLHQSRGAGDAASALLKPPQMREGVPLAVYNSFAVEAIKQWPGNYQKQDTYIRAKIDTYKRLRP